MLRIVFILCISFEMNFYIYCIILTPSSHFCTCQNRYIDFESETLLYRFFFYISGRKFRFSHRVFCAFYENYIDFMGLMPSRRFCKFQKRYIDLNVVTHLHCFFVYFRKDISTSGSRDLCVVFCTFQDWCFGFCTTFLAHFRKEKIAIESIYHH